MTDAAAAPPARPLAAAVWMLGAVASFSAMAIAGREVALGLGTFALMMYRSLIGLAIVLAVALARGRLGALGTRRPGLHALRNIAHFTGQNLWFYAVAVIPLAQVFALEFSVPIWVALAAPFVLGEPLTRRRLLAALAGFCGILIIARPGAAPLSPGLVAAALSALAFAATALATKRLTATEPVIAIMFWLTLMQAALGLATAWPAGQLRLPLAAEMPWVAVVALGGLAAHFCIANAMRLAPAVIVTPLDFIRLPLIAVLGMALYGEPLDGWVFLGAAIIFGANYANLWAEARALRRPAP